ncbi:MAG TPA: glycosyltransferase family 4 protein, partial [Thermoanaerobaculia bacterium]
MKIVLIGPVSPYRAGIAYCTQRLAEELAREHEVEIVSFSRQYPRWFYPGKDDRDPTLAKTPSNARFTLDVLNPLTWVREALRLRRERPDAVIFVWWIWVWAKPYLTIRTLLPRGTKVVFQCHNVGDKEPAWWKSVLTNAALRRADHLVVHAKSEAEEVRRRLSRANVTTTFLPVHELGGEIPSREEARARLQIPAAKRVALFFGHVRPFKGLDIALDAWTKIDDAMLLVAGEVWWSDEERYLELARAVMTRVRLDFRFIPDAEIATYFAACDVVVAPYRQEAQSGVALTAFHFARPVIATTVGGIPEIIEDGVNGLLIPPESP